MADNDEVRMVLSADVTDFEGKMTAAGEAMAAALAKGSISVEQLNTLMEAGIPVMSASGAEMDLINQRMTAFTAATEAAAAAQAELNAAKAAEETGGVKFNKNEDAIEKQNRFGDKINSAGGSANTFRKTQTLGDPTVISGEKELLAAEKVAYEQHLVDLAAMIPQRQAVLEKLTAPGSVATDSQLSKAGSRLQEAENAEKEATSLGILGAAQTRMAASDWGARVSAQAEYANKAFIDSAEVQAAFGQKVNKLTETAKADAAGFADIVALRQTALDNLRNSTTASANQIEMAEKRLASAQEAMALGGPSVVTSQTGSDFTAKLNHDIIDLNQNQIRASEVAKEFGAAESEVSQVAQNAAKYVEAEGSSFGRIAGVVGGATGALGANTSAVNFNRVGYEAVAVAHEAMSNRWSRIPTSISIFTQALLGLSAAQTLVAVGAVVVVGGLGYLIYKAIETDREMTALGNALMLTGRGADDAKGFIKTMSDELDNMGGVSSKTREKLLDFYSSNASLTRENIIALTELEESYGKAFGDKSAGMIEQIGRRLGDLSASTLPSLDREFLGLSSTQYTLIKNMLDMGNVAGAQAAIITAQNEKEGKSYEDVDQKLAVAKTHVDELTKAIADLVAQPFHFEGASEELLELTTELEKAKTAVDAFTNAKKDSAAQRLDMSIKADVDEADKINEKDDPRAKLQKQYDDMAAAIARGKEKLAAATAAGDKPGMQAAQMDIDKETTAQRNLNVKTTTLNETEQKGQGSDAIGKAREQISEIQALQQGSREQQLAQEAAVWSGVLQTENLSKDQRLEVERSYHIAVAQMTSVSKEVKLTELRAEVAEAKSGSQERIVAAQNEVNFVRTAYGEQSTQFKSAQKDLVQAQNAASDQRKKVSEKEIEDEIRSLDRKLAARLRELDEEVKAHEISAARRAQLEVNEVTGTAAQEATLYDKLMSLYDKDGVAFQSAEDKKVAAAQKFADKVTAINDKMAADAQKMFTGMLGPLTSAMDSMVSGLMAGRQTFKNIAAQALREMLTQEIEAQIKVQMQKLSLYAMDLSGYKSTQAQKDAISDSSNNTMLGSAWRLLFGERATDTASLASKATTETGKTGATVAGESTRTAVTGTASVTEAAKDTASVATHTAAEAAKTTGTIAGEAARTAATAAGQAAEDTVGAASVTKDAAKAAAGAYAAVVDIPYVGPILAPAAAAVAYGAVMAFNVFHEGAWDVPHDQMGYLQKGESIVPTKFATGMRAAIASGGGDGGKGGGGGDNHLHMNYSPTLHVGAGSTMNRAEFSKMLSSHSGTLVGDVRNMINKGWRPK